VKRLERSVSVGGKGFERRSGELEGRGRRFMVKDSGVGRAVFLRRGGRFRGRGAGGSVASGVA
jgi:hypothetical protein